MAMMFRAVPIIAAAALLGCAAARATPPSGSVPDQPVEIAGEPSPIVIGQSFTLHSRVLGKPRKVNVYVPPGYAGGEKRYPVLYVIDGGEAQDFHHISGIAQLGTIAGTTAEIIVVGIETVDRASELTSAAGDPRYREQWPTHGASGDFRRHIADEVIPFVERRFRTSGDTAVIGESLAGLFIVETFLRQPALFDHYIAISPSLWWDTRSLSREASALMAGHDEAERTLFLVMADEGGTMQDGMERLVAALQASAPSGLQWMYEARPHETHASIYHGAALDAVRRIWGIDTRQEAASWPWWLRDSPAAE
jgi:predicted alpha/beta superfamily hydrolase